MKNIIESVSAVWFLGAYKGHFSFSVCANVLCVAKS